MLSLSSRLAISRLTDNRSGLDALAVLAFVVTSWLALTVAGGTTMFIERAANPPQPFLDAAEGSELPMSVAQQASMYPALATIACALLVIPIFTLGGGAARLGASGRARRLASLRLIGMTGGEVVLMSVIESVVLSTLGALIGVGLWLISLPAWSAVNFLGEPLHAGEMLMPVWLAIAVIAAIVLLAALSTLIGLQRVRISPLGVAKRESARGVTIWRVVAFLATVAGFFVIAQGFQIRTASLVGFMIIGGFIAAVVFGMNLIGPFIIQLVARPLTRTSNPSFLLAMRRLIADPKAAWRNVSAVALLGIIAAFTVAVPADLGVNDELIAIQFRDMRTGAIITLAIGMLLAATSTLINQASATVDRAEQTIALTRMGSPFKVFTSARVSQVLLPMITTLAISIPVGLLLASPFITQVSSLASSMTTTALTVAGFVGAGIALSLIAALACSPIERRILAADYRPND
ncbi:hypothetical protein BSZ39_01210 [Bowdeniella nasicola]|uniref:FtsX-like permease family protein n=1 Tax=Bowdeniella nasicola TaxID=208480 RepID=A0A1Q5Q5N9_9ACTO|nr:FtsX-like permease family protein [Bowdeniella nasicola]OKL55022.1 hypothetical protein BSZ39_01210 [Bowdeniella nasicola]